MGEMGKTDRKLKGLIMGAGFMGSTHLNCYGSDSRVQILGIVDTDIGKARSLAARWNLKPFLSIEQAYEYFEDIDFVDVCLPSSFHKTAVVKAFACGANVIVEKPISVSIEDANDMITASNNAGKRLMVAHVCRFMPQYAYAKRIIESLRLGKPFAFSAFRESEAPSWSWNNWFQNRELSGGTLLDLSIHDIDIANWFLGQPAKYKAFISTIKEKSGSECITSSISYMNGGHATIIASHLMPKGYPFSAGFRLVFEGGCIDWNNGMAPNGFLMISSDNKQEIVNIEKEFPKSFANPYEAELNSFISCLISGAPFIIKPEEALLALKTVQSLYDNSEELSVSEKMS